MSYAIACGDVMDGCPATFEAESKDELMGQVVEHARDAHGIDEVTPEVASAVGGAIRET
jgi:predicted small metal-binding protein